MFMTREESKMPDRSNDQRNYSSNRSSSNNTDSSADRSTKEKLPHLVPQYLSNALSSTPDPPAKRASGGERFHGVVDIREINKQSNKYSSEDPLKKAVLDSFEGDPGIDAKVWKEVDERLRRRLTESYGRSHLMVPLELLSPLVCGVGIESITEVGFSFQNPFGLPYYPGSSIKGLARRAAADLDWPEEKICSYFGEAITSTEDQGNAGMLCFLDAYLEPKYTIEIMTPHISPYLQSSGKDYPPSDIYKPTPIRFLAVAPGAKVTIHVLARNPKDNTWRDDVEMILEYLAKYGLGAKTSAGYGVGQIDDKAKDRAEEEVKQQEQRRQKESYLRSLDPNKRKLEELKSEKRFSSQTPPGLYISILKDKEATADDPSFMRYVAQLAKDSLKEQDSWLDEKELQVLRSNPKDRSISSKKRNRLTDVELIIGFLAEE